MEGIQSELVVRQILQEDPGQEVIRSYHCRCFYHSYRNSPLIACTKHYEASVSYAKANAVLTTRLKPNEKQTVEMPCRLSITLHLCIMQFWMKGRKTSQ